MNNEFYCVLEKKERYIICSHYGIPSKEGLVKTTGEVLGFIESTGMKRLFHDTTHVVNSNPHTVISQGIVSMRLISEKTVKIASYVPVLRLFIIAKFISLLSGRSNWKFFRDKQKALKWLLSNNIT